MGPSFLDADHLTRVWMRLTFANVMGLSPSHDSADSLSPSHDSADSLSPGHDSADSCMCGDSCVSAGTLTPSFCLHRSTRMERIPRPGSRDAVFFISAWS
eukprot:1161796-Pelagomonas_calceolata.AAC.8